MRGEALKYAPMTAVNESQIPEPELPPKPDHPLSTDCCGGGCADCVFTIYIRDVKLWTQEVKEIRRLHAEKLAALGGNTEPQA